MSPANSAFAARRAADRRRWLAQVEARPAAARFRSYGLNVRLLGEPAKVLTMRSAGFDPGYTCEIVLVLPVWDPKPVVANEPIEVTDLSGATQLYEITSPTALEGTGCYRCSLTVRRGRPLPAGPR